MTSIDDVSHIVVDPFTLAQLKADQIQLYAADGQEAENIDLLELEEFFAAKIVLTSHTLPNGYKLLQEV